MLPGEPRLPPQPNDAFPNPPFGMNAESRDERIAPGWWQASNHRWYPPHLHPRYEELQRANAAEIADRMAAVSPDSTSATTPILGNPRGLSTPEFRINGIPARFWLFGVLILLVAVAVKAAWIDDDPATTGTGDTTSGSVENTVVTVAGQRIAAWSDMESSDCFEWLNRSRPDITSVKVVPCGREHDGQVLSVERGSPVLNDVISSLMGAALGKSGSVPTSPAPGSPPTVPSVAPRSKSTDDLIDKALQDRCGRLAASLVSGDAPPGLRYFAVYSDNITTQVGSPTLLCVASRRGLRLTASLVR